MVLEGSGQRGTNDKEDHGDCHDGSEHLEALIVELLADELG